MQVGQIKRVGVIGGGQLAWMMVPAADRLGLELVVQTPHTTDPAAPIAAETVIAAIDDASATDHLATLCDVITFENEFVDLPALSSLAEKGVRFLPSLETLAPLLDKYDQRCFLRDRGLPVPQFTLLPIHEGIPEQQPLTFPLVLKARRHGYDGQGTFIVQTWEELEGICQRLGQPSVLVEELVPFERELAVMVARSLTGEVVIYPVVETQQEKQVCHRVMVPADLPPVTLTEVEAIARTLMEQLNAVGIFGIELFLTRTGKVLINEIAPRTHNSGHYTIDACETSQFEQQLRVVAQLPLGSPQLKGAGAVMVNLLGYEISQSDYRERRNSLAAIPHAQVHWYGKTQSYPGRKLGHVTVRIPTGGPALKAEAAQIAQAIEVIWYGK